MSVENIDTNYSDTGGVNDLDEIVFENRNKAYGAYALRQSYRFELTKAFIIGSLLFIFAVVAPLIYLNITKDKAKDQKIVSVELDDINQQDLPPAVDEETAPPPPPPPAVEPPKQEIVRDMIPEPKPNPKVEQPPKKFEDVKNTTIGTINQEGTRNNSYTPPPPPVTGSGGTGVVEAPKPKVTNEIVERVDQEATFASGGINRFREMASNNFDVGAVEGEGTLRTVVTFVVERDGSITNIKATGSNSDFNREAERTVRSVRGKWNPGKLNGEPVRSRFRFPFTMQYE